MFTIGWKMLKITSWGDSVHKIILSAPNNSLTPSFSVWMPRTYFSCLLLLLESPAILNKNGESGRILVLFLSLQEMFSASHCYAVVKHGLIRLRYSPSIPTLLRSFFLFIKECWIFKYFSASFEMIIIFILHFVIVGYHTHWSAGIN